MPRTAISESSDPAGVRGDEILTGSDDQDYLHLAIVDGVGNDIMTDFGTESTGRDIFGFGDIAIEKMSKAEGDGDCKLIMDNGSTILLEDVTTAEFQDDRASLP